MNDFLCWVEKLIAWIHRKRPKYALKAYFSVALFPWRIAVLSSELWKLLTTLDLAQKEHISTCLTFKTAPSHYCSNLHPV